MTPENLVRTAIEPALSLLPGKMDTKMAKALLVAIAWQESRITHRRQIRGPARGYWQFETGGVKGVLTHHSSREPAREVLKALDYDTSDAVYILTVIEHNDVLAAAFARLLLYTLPKPLPDNPRDAWFYYLAAWRPGKPHESSWADAWSRGSVLV